MHVPMYVYYAIFFGSAPTLNLGPFCASLCLNQVKANQCLERYVN